MEIFKGKSAKWMFNSEAAAHLLDDGTKAIPVSAFRSPFNMFGRFY